MISLNQIGAGGWGTCAFAAATHKKTNVKNRIIKAGRFGRKLPQFIGFSTRERNAVPPSRFRRI